MADGGGCTRERALWGDEIKQHLPRNVKALTRLATCMAQSPPFGVINVGSAPASSSNLAMFRFPAVVASVMGLNLPSKSSFTSAPSLMSRFTSRLELVSMARSIAMKTCVNHSSVLYQVLLCCPPYHDTLYNKYYTYLKYHSKCCVR